MWRIGRPDGGATAPSLCVPYPKHDCRDAQERAVSTPTEESRCVSGPMSDPHGQQLRHLRDPIIVGVPVLLVVLLAAN